MDAFGDAPDLLSWVRLGLGLVAVVHALLCARVVLIRLTRRGTAVDVPHPERVPTAAMVAYGITTANMARVLLMRIVEGDPFDPTSLLAHAATLLAGSIAFTQIVVLKRRATRLAPTRRNTSEGGR